MLWADITYVSLLLFSVAIGPYYQKIEDLTIRQWASTVIGLVLAILVSGMHILHPLIMTVVNALIITKLSHKTQHLYSFFFSFFYLLVIFRLGDLVGLPTPPTHTNLIVMIMTLKLSGLAFEINSAASASDDDTEGVNSDALKAGVGFMDVIHYSFSYMGLLTGPYYRYRTYWDSLHRPFAKYSDPWPLTLYKLQQTAVFTVLFLIMSEIVPVQYVLSEEFGERSFLYKLGYLYPAFAVFRLRLFIGMRLAECSCQMSGLGAYPASCNTRPGLGPKEYKNAITLSTDVEKLKKENYDYETIHNMDVWQVETLVQARTTMKVWNACIQYWMATCVYKRFPSKSLRTAVTLVLSALWHGYAAGYYTCICQVTIFLPLEDLYAKFYTQCEDNSIAKKGWAAFLWCMKLTCMAYLGIPFMLLDLHGIIHFYKSIYFFGHILGIVLYVIGRILKPYVLTRKSHPEPGPSKTKTN